MDFLVVSIARSHCHIMKVRLKCLQPEYFHISSIPASGLAEKNQAINKAPATQDGLVTVIEFEWKNSIPQEPYWMYCRKQWNKKIIWKYSSMKGQEQQLQSLFAQRAIEDSRVCRLSYISLVIDRRSLFMKLWKHAF